MSPLEFLLDDLETDLRDWRQLPLYEFSWALRGLDRGLTEDEIAVICQQAYDEITVRHTLHLEWLEWPDSVPTGRRAEPGTTPDFDINTRGEIESPFLALVPD